MMTDGNSTFMEICLDSVKETWWMAKIAHANHIWSSSRSLTVNQNKKRDFVPIYNVENFSWCRNETTSMIN